jgi:hypothetical protein
MVTPRCGASAVGLRLRLRCVGRSHPTGCFAAARAPGGWKGWRCVPGRRAHVFAHAKSLEVLAALQGWAWAYETLICRKCAA